MNHTFCECMMWHGFPLIRKKIAESMMDDFGLNQKEAAEKLGISSAAVCQYISKKRAKIEMADDYLLREIRQSAENIINIGSEHMTIETCRICKIIRYNGASSLLPAADQSSRKFCCCETE